MPAALMSHDSDPRDELIIKVGDISDIEIFANVDINDTLMGINRNKVA